MFVAEADESDGSFLVYRPEVARRHQRPARPPRLLRHLRARPGGLRRVRRVHPSTAACWWPATTTRGRGRWPQRGPRGRPQGAHLRLVARRRCRPGGELASRGLMSRVAVRRRRRAPSRTLRITIPGRHNLLNAAAAYTAAVGRPGPGPRAGPRRALRLHRDPPPLRAQGVAAGVTRGRRLRAQPRQGRRGRGHGRRARPRAGPPRSWSSSRTCTRAPATSRREFAAALAPADAVVLMEVYGAREDPVPGVSSALVARRRARVPPRARTSRSISSWSAVAEATGRAAPAPATSSSRSGPATSPCSAPSSCGPSSPA